jgi:hypothetical protein
LCLFGVRAFCAERYFSTQTICARMPLGACNRWYPTRAAAFLSQAASQPRARPTRHGSCDSPPPPQSSPGERYSRSSRSPTTRPHFFALGSFCALHGAYAERETHTAAGAAARRLGQALARTAPNARSILAMTWLFGMALPDSYSLITCGCMLSCVASCFCVSPLALRACVMARRRSFETEASVHRRTHVVRRGELALRERARGALAHA